MPMTKVIPSAIVLGEGKIMLGKYEYEYKKLNQHGDISKPAYVIRGVSRKHAGAGEYFLYRNVHSAHMMQVVNAKNIRSRSAFRETRFSDENGFLTFAG